MAIDSSSNGALGQAERAILYQPRAERALVASVLVQRAAWALADHLPASAFAERVCQLAWELLIERRGRLSVEGAVAHMRALGLGGEVERLLPLAQGSDAVEELVSLVAEAAANREFAQTLQRGKALLEPSNAALSAQERIDDVVDRLRRIASSSGSYRTDTFAEGLAQAQAEFAWRLENPGQVTGLRLHYRDIDDTLLGGLDPGNLVILASSPGEGKSILVGEVARRLAMLHQDDGQPRSLVFFGVEMSAAEMAGRFVSSLSRVSGDKLRDGRLLGEREIKAVQAAFTELERELRPRFHYRGPADFATIDDVARQAKFYVKEHGAAAVFVDYIQRVRTRTSYGERHDLGIAEITSKLKSLAAELRVPVIAVSQITREAIRERQGRPRLIDLAEGSGVERDADYVVGVWRPARHLEGEQAVKTWSNVAVLELLKGRFRRQSTVYLAFNGECSRFDDLDLTTRLTLTAEPAQRLLQPASEATRRNKK